MTSQPSRLAISAFLILALGASSGSDVSIGDPVADKTIPALADEMKAGTLTSESLVQAYQHRIDALDRGGPALQAVLAVNPKAVTEAQALDAERQKTGARSPLHGIPILVKDNIETADDMPTTAGSLALKDYISHRDAPVIARLRAAGAIILGKTNLSEWANIRGFRAVSGWSGVGGLTRNPYALDRTACGSSSGSAAAIAAGYAAAAIGTETDGSITCPAAINGIAGLKPTLGLLSRTHIVPISHSQDTPGPMAQSVTDLAVLLNIMQGTDASDPATRDADAHHQDFTKDLDDDALKGKRIGVMRFLTGYHPETDAVFEHALDMLRDAGAIVVDVPKPDGIDAVGDAETTVLMTELKADMAAYLATTPTAVKPRSLADLIAFNNTHRERELSLFGQELFEKAQATNGLDDPGYKAALALSKKLAGPAGIDHMLAAGNYSALVAPTNGPAWIVDTANGDHDMGGASQLPAVAGYPHLTVPMGQVFGLPVGLSFIGPAWSDATLLAYGYAFELRRGPLPGPAYTRTLAIDPALATLLAPARSGRRLGCEGSKARGFAPGPHQGVAPLDWHLWVGL